MTRYRMTSAATRACDRMTGRFGPISLAGTAKEATMKTLSLIAALTVAAPAFALETAPRWSRASCGRWAS